MEPEAPAATEPKYTATDCTRLGVRVLVTAFILSQLAAGGMLALELEHVAIRSELYSHYLKAFAQTVYVLLPVQVLVGACVGREAYRQAVGSHPVRGEGTLTYIIAITALPFSIPALAWLDLRGGIGGRKRVGITGPILVAVSMLGMLYLFSQSLGTLTAGAMRGLQIGLNTAVSLAGAFITFDWIAVRQNRRLLILPQPDRLRFSLRTLLIAVLLLGGFVSGLVLLFGS